MSRKQPEKNESSSSGFFGMLLKGIGIGLAVGAIGVVAGYAILTLEDLEKIPEKLIKSATREECSICLDAYEENDCVKILHCKHMYHSKCIAQWVARNTNCPLCRANV